MDNEQFDILNKKLDAALELLSALTLQGELIMADFTSLTAAITQETSVEASVLTMLKGLQANVAALSPNQTAIDALATQIQQNITAMTAAVPVNTPVSAAQAKATR